MTRWIMRKPPLLPLPLLLEARRSLKRFLPRLVPWNGFAVRDFSSSNNSLLREGNFFSRGFALALKLSVANISTFIQKRFKGLQFLFAASRSADLFQGGLNSLYLIQLFSQTLEFHLHMIPLLNGNQNSRRKTIRAYHFWIFLDFGFHKKEIVYLPNSVKRKSPNKLAII